MRETNKKARLHPFHLNSWHPAIHKKFLRLTETHSPGGYLSVPIPCFPRAKAR